MLALCYFINKKAPDEIIAMIVKHLSIDQRLLIGKLRNKSYINRIVAVSASEYDPINKTIEWIGFQFKISHITNFNVYALQSFLVGIIINEKLMKEIFYSLTFNPDKNEIKSTKIITIFDPTRHYMMQDDEDPYISREEEDFIMP